MKEKIRLFRAVIHNLERRREEHPRAKRARARRHRGGIRTTTRRIVAAIKVWIDALAGRAWIRRDTLREAPFRLRRTRDRHPSSITLMDRQLERAQRKARELEAWLEGREAARPGSGRLRARGSPAR